MLAGQVKTRAAEQEADLSKTRCEINILIDHCLKKRCEIVVLGLSITLGSINHVFNIKRGASLMFKFESQIVI